MFSKKCKLHLEDVEQDAFTHMYRAIRVAIRLQLLVSVLIVHSVVPRLFTDTATDVMNDILNIRKKSAEKS